MKDSLQFNTLFPEMTPDSLQPAWQVLNGKRGDLSARERERHAGREKKETPPRMPEFSHPLPILTSAMQVK